MHLKETIKILAPVIQKVDNAIRRINPYPLHSTIGFAMTYPLDSDFSGGAALSIVRTTGPCSINILKILPKRNFLTGVCRFP